MLEIQVLSENRMMDGKREGWWGVSTEDKTIEDWIWSATCPAQPEELSGTAMIFLRWKLLRAGSTGYTVKKVIVFPSTAGMSLTKLTLAGNNLFTPVQGEIGWWHHRKIGNLVLQCILLGAAHSTAASYCQLLLLEYSYMTQNTPDRLDQCSRAPMHSLWGFL